MARKKTAVKTETRISAGRIFIFTGMIVLAGMVISVFLTVIFTR